MRPREPAAWAAESDGKRNQGRPTGRPFLCPRAASTVVPLRQACEHDSREGLPTTGLGPLKIEEATEDDQLELASWRSPAPYDFYDGDVDPVLNPERFFVARDEEGGLVGFYYFEPKPPELDYGLGLRPDLVGRGLGLKFFLAGLAFARERYAPRRVSLHVAAFNERARRVYERAGFVVVSRHVRRFERFGEVPFLTMAEDLDR